MSEVEFKQKVRGRLSFIPVELLATPRDGETMVDRWWVCHPEHGTIWHQHSTRMGWSPQCNLNEHAARTIGAKLYNGADYIHIPIAYPGRWDEEWGLRPDSLFTVKWELVLNPYT